MLDELQYHCENLASASITKDNVINVYTKAKVSICFPSKSNLQQENNYISCVKKYFVRLIINYEDLNSYDKVWIFHIPIPYDIIIIVAPKFWIPKCETKTPFFNFQVE